ncbi:MAG: N-6 DNA methylase [Candidatus Nanoarchaeia archaeon]|nr:N-6 DNA methylase [Candidatus Nanoarchaeia archaeon]
MAKNLIRRHSGYKGMAKVGREADRRLAEAQMEMTRKMGEAMSPHNIEKQETENIMFTITPSKHTQTGKDIWVAKLETRVSTDEFNELRKKIGKLGGYYSRFVSGFIFNEDPTDKLRSLSAGLPVTSEPKISKRLDLPKLETERKSPRKDVIIKEIQEGKMEFAVHKRFDGMTDSYDYLTVTNESFLPAENAVKTSINKHQSNYLIDELDQAKGQSHWVYSATVQKSDIIGYYIDFGDYYIRYKGETGTGEKPKEEIPGGKAEGMSMEDIANKHGRDLGFMMEQLEKGSEVEMEHTNDHDKAIEIAKDHLAEFPDYYIELRKMEKKLEKQSESKILSFDEFKKKLPDIASPFVGEEGIIFKAKYDKYSDKTKYFKHGRSNSKSISVKEAYDSYLHDAQKTESPDSMTAEEISDGTTPDSILADKLMVSESIVTDELGIESGDQLYADIELQKKYIQAMNGKLKELNITSLSGDVHDLLEDENYSSLNWYLALSGIYGETRKNVYLKLAKEMKAERSTSRSFFPELFEGKAVSHEENKSKPLKASDIPAEVKTFMPKFQQDIIIGSTEHYDILQRLVGIIRNMPLPYGTDDIKSENKIVSLHYFYGDSDWYIVEKDSDPEQIQAFGYVILNSDNINAEWGYVNIEELKESGKVELDFFWEPKEFRDIGTGDDPYINIKDFYIYKETNDVYDHEGNMVHDSESLEDAKKWIEDQYQPILGEKPYRVFTVTKDGSEGLYRDNLTFNEAEQLYNDELKNPNAEIITWDKTIYNEYGKVSSHENIKMEIHKDPEPVIEDTSKKFEAGVKETIKEVKKKEPETKAEKTEDSTNKKIRDLIAQKDLNRHLYSRADLLLLTQYTGDTKTQEESKDGYLWDYYTPDETVKLCWQLAFKYGFRASESRKILEPSAGAGRFLRYAPDYCQVTAYEIDEIAYKICTLLYPKFNIIHDSFESHFYIRAGLKGFNYKPVYDTFNLIIGNPPYMYPYTSVYKEKEKAVYPFIQSLEQWFLIRACDALEKNGLLIFIIPSSIVDNNSSYREFKDAMAKKVNMLDLYRLPSGTFKNTDITTDVIVLQKM